MFDVVDRWSGASSLSEEGRDASFLGLPFYGFALFYLRSFLRFESLWLMTWTRLCWAKMGICVAVETWSSTLGPFVGYWLTSSFLPSIRSHRSRVLIAAVYDAPVLHGCMHASHLTLWCAASDLTSSLPVTSTSPTPSFVGL